MPEGNSASSSSSNGMLPAPSNSSNHELKPTTPSGGRKQFTIPKLDEKQLEMKLTDANGTNSTFVVAEGVNSAPTEGVSAPLNSNAPAFVFGAGGAYSNANVIAADSPSNAAYLALLQQQSLQYQLQHATAADQELFATHNLLQQCPRAVLLMVLSSIIDENPTLCPCIRQRCEKASLVISQHQQAAAAGRFTSHAAGGAQWTPHATASNYESPRAAAYTGNASPHATSTRKGRGNKLREEGICSVHNSVRSMNHLQLNKQTGMYECVHGFHCLEDGGSAAVTPSKFNRASSTSAANNNGTGAGSPIAGPHCQLRASPAHVRPMRCVSESTAATTTTNNNNNNVASSSGSTNNNKLGSAELGHGNSDDEVAAQNGGGPPARQNASAADPQMDELKNILQTVREMAEREEN